MPTYDYRCTECGREFAAEQGMTEKPLRKCRECGGKLEKLLPKSINLIFKGSGFYVTDYKKPESRPASASKDSSSEAASSKIKDTVDSVKEKAKKKDTKS